jgi:hypothetical protein
MTYDDWKTTNSEDRYLGPDPDIEEEERDEFVPDYDDDHPWGEVEPDEDVLQCVRLACRVVVDRTARSVGLGGVRL